MANYTRVNRSPANFITTLHRCGRCVLHKFIPRPREEVKCGRDEVEPSATDSTKFEHNDDFTNILRHFNDMYILRSENKSKCGRIPS